MAAHADHFVLEVDRLQDVGLLPSLSDLAPIATCTELRVLNLRDTPAADLAPLAALDHLRFIRHKGLAISDGAALALQAACLPWNSILTDRWRRWCRT